MEVGIAKETVGTPTFYDTIKSILEPYVGQQLNFDDEWLEISGKLTSAILNTYEVKVKELLEETFNNSKNEQGNSSKHS